MNRETATQCDTRCHGWFGA